jgi:hypothetical protein
MTLGKIPPILVYMMPSLQLTARYNEMAKIPKAMPRLPMDTQKYIHILPMNNKAMNFSSSAASNHRVYQGRAGHLLTYTTVS